MVAVAFYSGLRAGYQRGTADSSSIENALEIGFLVREAACLQQPAVCSRNRVLATMEMQLDTHVLGANNAIVRNSFWLQNEIPASEYEKFIGNALQQASLLRLQYPRELSSDVQIAVMQQEVDAILLANSPAQ